MGQNEWRRTHITIGSRRRTKAHRLSCSFWLRARRFCARLSRNVRPEHDKTEYHAHLSVCLLGSRWRMRWPCGAYILSCSCNFPRERFNSLAFARLIEHCKRFGMCLCSNQTQISYLLASCISCTISGVAYSPRVFSVRSICT